jgi:hypothetical protein
VQERSNRGAPYSVPILHLNIKKVTLLGKNLRGVVDGAVQHPNVLDQVDIREEGVVDG